jgi:hypothetical protein
MVSGLRDAAVELKWLKDISQNINLISEFGYFIGSDSCFEDTIHSL